jgi:hypothetical protein
MLKWIKKMLKMFSPSVPTHLELAIAELEGARRELLEAQSKKELYENDASYHRQRISRLTGYIQTHSQEQGPRE